MNDDKVSWIYHIDGNTRNVQRSVVEVYWKTSFGRRGRREEGNLKMVLKKIVCEDGRWMELAEYCF
jgi:hypothetical protein